MLILLNVFVKNAAHLGCQCIYVQQAKNIALDGLVICDSISVLFADDTDLDEQINNVESKIPDPENN